MGHPLYAQLKSGSLSKSYFKVATGPLFFNSRTDAPIHKSTDSRLIRAVIDEADPGKFPRVHNCLVPGFKTLKRSSVELFGIRQVFLLIGFHRLEEAFIVLLSTRDRAYACPPPSPRLVLTEL